METNEFELIVIGGGPGGYTAAAHAAKQGMKTLLIENRELGGTCLNRGCVPTKALLHCSGMYRSVKDGAAYGVQADLRDFEYSAAFTHKEKTVQRLRMGVESIVKRSGCTLLRGEAVLRDANSVQVGEDVFSFQNLIIAAGSIPAPFPFQAEADETGTAPNLVNSDGFLALNQIPPRVVVIGGGVIGLEFATILSEIGRQVTVVEAMDRVLPPLDAELAAVVRKTLEKAGVKFHTQTFVKRVTRRNDETICEIEHAGVLSELSADLVVCAIGRIANTAGLHCERADLRMNRSFIEVNEYCETSTPHIYAIGDANGRCMLAHAAAYQGRKVVENLLAQEPQSCLSAAVPACVYTNPELASVGLTEEAVKQQGREIQVRKISAVANGKLLTMGEKNGFVKLIADAHTGEVLGCQIATPHATDMIAEIALLMKQKGTVQDLGETIHPHPTISEMLMDVSLG